MTESLSTTEADRLAALEQVIDRGKQTFVEVGNALSEIRDSRIYRATHATFEAYCKDRWGFSRFQAHRMIEAAGISNVLPIGNKPTTESQARPLAKLEPEQQPAAWEKAQEIAKEEGKPVTARHVEAAVAASLPPTRPKPFEWVEHLHLAEEGEQVFTAKNLEGIVITTTTPAEPTRPEPINYTPADALNIWATAKSVLDRIHANDTHREAALSAMLKYVSDRITNNR